LVEPGASGRRDSSIGAGYELSTQKSVSFVLAFRWNGASARM
jgi:hypothetical protein